MSEPKPAGVTCSPAALQLPAEDRTWLGGEVSGQSYPNNEIKPLPWLSAEEHERLLSWTWDGFTQILRTEGYAALSRLRERLSALRDLEEERATLFKSISRQTAADAIYLNQLIEKYGRDTLVCDVAGTDGWELVGECVAVRQQDVEMQDRRRSFMIVADVTWGKALQIVESDLESYKPWLKTRTNEYLLSVFRDETIEEVCRLFELYGVVHDWMDREGLRETGHHIRDLELVRTLSNSSLRLSYISNDLFDAHYHEGGWRAVAAAFRAAWKDAGLDAASMPYDEANPDEINRKVSRYRERMAAHRKRSDNVG
ncbi:hypothetical protein [Rubricoccus marinus]|uniref:hypothetical protein n=1 Tax=Rubricoccus marinus TaxID=716817 RepID=UPI00117A4312|nr:hypothetical protein [Rubricoccus marinus]